MKRIILIGMALALITTAALAVPQTLGYSSRLMENGVLVTGTKTIGFRIVSDAAGSSALWTTTNTEVTVRQGIYHVQLGGIAPSVFAGDTAYLEVTVEGETLLPRTRINAVGYALQAAAVTGTGNVFPSGGNVGIGTTAPWAKLDVAGSGLGGAPHVQAKNDTDSAGEDASIRTYVQGANAGDPYYKAVVNGVTEWSFGIDNSDSDKFKIAIGGALGTVNDKLTIDTAGNIGIGTTAPIQKLTINDGNIQINRSYPILYLTDSDSTGDAVGGIISYKDSNANTVGYVGFASEVNDDFYINNAFNGGHIILSTNSGNVGIGNASPSGLLHVSANSLVVLNNGNVGIGTTAPSIVLQVEGVVGTYGPNDLLDDYVAVFKGTNGHSAVGVDSSANDKSTSIRLMKNSSPKWGLINKASTDDLLVYSYSQSDTVMAITSPNGNVGIGTTEPSWGKLVIKGATTNAFLSLESETSSAGDTGVIKFGFGAYSAVAQIKAIVEGGEINGALGFHTRVVGDEYERVRITSAGNVGIGTTAPGEQVEISGTSPALKIYAANDNGQAEVKLFADRGDDDADKFAIVAGNDNLLHFKDASTGRWLTNMVIDSTDGNVGIGTTAPSTSVHIAKGSGDAVIRLENSDGIITDGETLGKLEYYSNDDGKQGISAYVAGVAYGVNGAGMLAFGTGVAGSATEAMRIASNGNVGIGTTDPSQKLDINNGYVKAKGIMDPSEATKIDLVNGAAYLYNGSFRAGADDTLDLGVQEYRFRSLNMGTGDSSFMGDVGIGTSAPEAKLHIYGAGLMIYNPAVGYGSIYSGSPGNDTYLVLSGGGGGCGSIKLGGLSTTYNKVIAFETNSEERMRISTNGNVGIGTTAPGSTFQVSGNMQLTEQAGGALSGACSTEGQIQYQNNTFYGCAGGTWTALH
ncbi:hypothetical protein ACFL4D_01240 [Candidatus Margulisiibacteriota bacterium]